MDDSRPPELPFYGVDKSCSRTSDIWKIANQCLQCSKFVPIRLRLSLAGLVVPQRPALP